MYNLKKEDITTAVNCLKSAFKEDPLHIKLGKGDDNLDASLTGFYATPLLIGLKYGKVCADSSEIHGVASWVNGKYADVNLWQMIFSGALSYGLKMSKSFVDNISYCFKNLKKDRKLHMKGKNYIYLSIIGVDELHQGKGYGSQLLNLIIKESNANGTPIYLETETENNVAFYEKHGFRVLKKEYLEKLDLPMWEMEYFPKTDK
ncbi:MAG: GNAT family N-acetyltransferase [Clostridia bacterium]|nr:GNAT family N-acetyltransferase [Clostridia bacterium]